MRWNKGNKLHTAVGVIGNSNDSHRLMRDICTEDFRIGSGELIRADHGPQRPVGPEDEVSVNCQAKECSGS